MKGLQNQAWARPLSLTHTMPAYLCHCLLAFMHPTCFEGSYEPETHSISIANSTLEAGQSVGLYERRAVWMSFDSGEANECMMSEAKERLNLLRSLLALEEKGRGAKPR